MWTGEGEIEIEIGAAAGGGSHILVAGDVDLATAPRLEDAVRAAVVPAGRVILDVRHVRFIDAAGLAALRAARLLAADAGAGFELVTGPGGAVRQMIARTRTDRMLRRVPARAAA